MACYSVPMIPVHHATPETFDGLVLTPRDELVVVYFWGPQCPNCEFFASRLPAVLEQLGDVPARLVKRIGKMSEFRGDAFFLGVLRDQLPAAG